MGTTKLLPILPTHIKTNLTRRDMLTQALHELLKILIMQTTILRQIRITICQRNEAILLMERSFMYTAHRPLAAALKATPYTTFSVSSFVYMFVTLLLIHTIQPIRTGTIILPAHVAMCLKFRSSITTSDYRQEFTCIPVRTFCVRLS